MGKEGKREELFTMKGRKIGGWEEIERDGGDFCGIFLGSEYFMGMSKNSTDATGKWGEKVAVRMLKKKGLKILGKRVRIGTRDEMDIIARDKDVLVFVEVKTRASETFGRPASAVNRKKRHLMSRGAVRYIKRLKNPSVYFRFDIVEVIGSLDEADPIIRHIPNAFQLDSQYSIFT